MKATRLLLLCLPGVAACTGQTYHAGAGVIFANARGDVALQNSSGSLVLHDNQNSLAGLGVDHTEASPYLRFETMQDKHRWRLHGFALDSEGSGELEGGFGDLPAGTSVTTELEFFTVAGSYAYELVHNDTFRLGLGGQLTYAQLDVSASAFGGREQVETSALVPMPYAELDIFLGDVTLGVDGGFMAADLGDADGRYVDVDVAARWYALQDFELMAGYRYFVFDAYGEASSRDFDADVEVRGWYLGGMIRF